MDNTILNDKFWVFAEEAKRTIPRTIKMDKDVLPELFHDFKYPVSSWPVLLNKELTNQLSEICTIIPELLTHIPALYFGNDIKKIADFYFEGDEMAAHFALMCIKKKMAISARLDLTLTNDGFKVLEVNMGSSIGGMEVQNFEPLIRRLHPNLLKAEHAANFIYKPTQSLYLEFIVDQILAHVSDDFQEINIFLANSIDEGRGALQKFFNDLLHKELIKRGRRGQVYSESIRKLQFDNQKLSFEGAKIHAVLTLDHGSEAGSMDLFRALAMNKVYYPDHMGTTMLKDKRNLAILYQLALEDKFDETNNKLILDCIPWTTKLAYKEVKYKGVNYDIIDLLNSSKNEFVIKIADGLQGQDVYIGKDIDAVTWEEVISNSLRNKKFIVQQYCPSIDLLAPDHSNEWEPHKLVWGAFGFGKNYGGVWVRMTAKESGSEVINSATGAVEVIVYESY